MSSPTPIYNKAPNVLQHTWPSLLRIALTSVSGTHTCSYKLRAKSSFFFGFAPCTETPVCNRSYIWLAQHPFRELVWMLSSHIAPALDKQRLANICYISNKKPKEPKRAVYIFLPENFDGIVHREHFSTLWILLNQLNRGRWSIQQKEPKPYGNLNVIIITLEWHKNDHWTYFTNYAYVSKRELLLIEYRSIVQ